MVRDTYSFCTLDGRYQEQERGWHVGHRLPVQEPEQRARRERHQRLERPHDGEHLADLVRVNVLGHHGPFEQA